jgi:hypothetical protein
MPDERAPVRYDDHLTSTGPKKFVTRSDAFVLSGYTAPNARIDVIREGEPLTAGAHTDASGRFHLKLPVTRHQQVLQLRIKVPSGFVTQDEFVLISDTQPPDLTLDKAPPSITADSTLRLAGTLNSGKSLFFNDTPVEIEHDRFQIVTKLAEGPNRLVLIARDVVGNERRWEKTIRLDREPPRLIDAKIVTPRPQIPGEIEVIVRAKDATGMKRYAWVTLKGGNMNKTVRLLLIDKSSGIYHKAMTVSGLSTGQIALINVRLEDYLGNQHVYDLE